MVLMTQEERLVYEHIENLPEAVFGASKQLEQLQEDYARFNETYFKNSLPRLSETFICTFQDLPRDNAGIYIDPDRADKLSTQEIVVRAGIRINSKLRDFTPHVRIVLLHEMVHASGIKGHNEEFQASVSTLLKAGAYEDLL